ncbi:MAG: hypothetical protein ABW138_08950, partial [Candidatus Thiodiazotropha sp. 4PDIVS1]
AADSTFLLQNPQDADAIINPVTINPATKYVVFSRSVPACGKASKRRSSTPTASFDNAVCRQAHFGLSFKNYIVRGFKPEDDILSRRVNK